MRVVTLCGPRGLRLRGDGARKPKGADARPDRSSEPRSPPGPNARTHTLDPHVRDALPHPGRAPRPASDRSTRPATPPPPRPPASPGHPGRARAPRRRRRAAGRPPDPWCFGREPRSSSRSGVERARAGGYRHVHRRLPDRGRDRPRRDGRRLPGRAGRASAQGRAQDPRAPARRRPPFRARFQRETDAAASIEHANVVPIYGAGEADGRLYLAMRYIEGTDLATLIAREGSLTPGRAARICAQVAEALGAAHERGIVHRDVKPGNVLLDGHDHAYLSDFGLVRQTEIGSGIHEDRPAHRNSRLRGPRADPGRPGGWASRHLFARLRPVPNASPVNRRSVGTPRWPRCTRISSPTAPPERSSARGVEVVRRRGREGDREARGRAVRI